MTIGDNIKRIAKQKGITIYKISKISGVSNSYLSEIVHNKKCNPSILVVKKIAKALEIPCEDILNETNISEVS